MTKGPKQLLTAAAIAWAAWSCTGTGTRTVDSAMADVNPFGWNEPALVSFENSDTLSLRDLSLALRCGAPIGEPTLGLTLEFTAPDSTRFTEHCSFPLHLQRKPVSAAATVVIPYRRNVLLRKQGTYTVGIKPDHNLRGVEAVGITFEKQL